MHKYRIKTRLNSYGDIEYVIQKREFWYLLDRVRQ